MKDELSFMFKKWYISYRTDPGFRTLKNSSLKNRCETCMPFEILNLTFRMQIEGFAIDLEHFIT